MDSGSRVELQLTVPRWQKALAWALAALYVAVALLALGEGWRRGVRGPGLWAPFVFRVLQGLVLQQVCLRVEAKVLQVEEGRLTVTTWFRRPFGRPRIELPIREAALEWIGSSLVLQTPQDGGQLRLGHAPAARGTADWLVARGAPPPVGG